MTLHTSPDTFEGSCILAFIDLLGFSAAVQRDWNSNEHSPLRKLMRIKAAALKDPLIPMAWVTKGSPGVDIYIPRVHTVSDSIVICMKMPEGIRHFFPTIFHMVDRASNCCVAALEEGFTVRGAIEIGEIYWNATETIGPALIDAYNIEAHIAKSARIILGPQLIDILTLNDQIIDNLRSLLVKCDDDLIAVSGSFALRGPDKKKFLAKLESLRDAASTDSQKNKYAFLIGCLTGAEKSYPSKMDFINCGKLLRGMP